MNKRRRREADCLVRNVQVMQRTIERLRNALKSKQAATRKTTRQLTLYQRQCWPATTGYLTV